MSSTSTKAQTLTVATVRRRLPWLMLVFSVLLVWAVALQAKAVVAVPLTVEGFDQVLVSPEPGHPQQPLQMTAISESGGETSRVSK